MVGDRRTKRRSRVVATIVLDPGAPHATHYVVRNLSAGGALLGGHPVPSLGTPLRVVLNLRTGKAINLAAQVVRHEPSAGATPTFAIAFHQVSADAEDLIQEAVLAELELSRLESDGRGGPVN
jgi:PilZ domain-containing protein